MIMKECGRAIVAIDEDGKGLLMKWKYIEDDWVTEYHDDYDDLAEGGYQVPPGVYYATYFIGFSTDYYGDTDSECKWEIDETIPILELKDIK